MERKAEQSSIYLWSFPSRRLPARRLPLEPTRPARSVLGISLLFFFFFSFSVLIVYLFLLPVQPLPSAGAPAAPIPGARPMGRAGCPSLPLLHLHLNLRERIQQLRLQGRGEEKRREEGDSNTPSRCHKAWGPRRSPRFSRLEELTEVSGRGATCHELWGLLFVSFSSLSFSPCL